MTSASFIHDHFTRRSERASKNSALKAPRQELAIRHSTASAVRVQQFLFEILTSWKSGPVKGWLLQAQRKLMTEHKEVEGHLRLYVCACVCGGVLVITQRLEAAAAAV